MGKLKNFFTDYYELLDQNLAKNLICDELRLRYPNLSSENIIKLISSIDNNSYKDINILSDTITAINDRDFEVSELNDFKSKMFHDMRHAQTVSERKRIFIEGFMKNHPSYIGTKDMLYNILEFTYDSIKWGPTVKKYPDNHTWRVVISSKMCSLSYYEFKNKNIIDPLRDLVSNNPYHSEYIPFQHDHKCNIFGLQAIRNIYQWHTTNFQKYKENIISNNFEKNNSPILADRFFQLVENYSKNIYDSVQKKLLYSNLSSKWKITKRAKNENRYARVIVYFSNKEVFDFLAQHFGNHIIEITRPISKTHEDILLSERNVEIEIRRQPWFEKFHFKMEMKRSREVDDFFYEEYEAGNHSKFKYTGDLLYVVDRSYYLQIKLTLAPYIKKTIVFHDVGLMVDVDPEESGE